MRKAKVVFWIVLFGFIGLIVFQNWAYFNTRQALNVDLFFGRYVTPDFPNCFYFLTCLLVGLLLPYAYGLVERLRLNKMIKRLQATAAAQQEEISALKQELDMTQQNPVETDQEPADTLGPAPET